MSAEIIPFKAPVPPAVRCSFCKAPESKVNKMVAAGGAAICDKCLAVATERAGMEPRP